MQQIKKFPYLAFIVAILFVTGGTFSSAFFTRLNLGTPTVLGEENESEDRDEVNDEEGQKDEEKDEEERDDEEKDQEDQEDEVKRNRGDSFRTGQKLEDEEDADDADEVDEDKDEANEKGDDFQEEVSDLNKDIRKVESRIDVLGANGVSVISFRLTLSEVKNLTSQAEAKLTSAPLEAEALLETADHKLERLEKLVKMTLGDEDEDDEDDDATEEIQDLTKKIAKLEVRLDALEAGGVNVSGLRVSLDAIKGLLVQAGEKVAAGDLAGAEALTEMADKKMEAIKHATELAFGDDDEEDGDEAKEYKNEVAQFVHNLKELGEMDGGIGQKVRLVAQAQNDATANVENSINEINERSEFAKFFIGPKYESLAEVQAAIVENQTRIGVLNDLTKQVTDPVVKQILQDEINQFQRENTRLQLFVTESESGFSLFGWMAKLLG